MVLSLQTDPSNLEVIVTLGAIGVLVGDKNLLQATLSEITSMPAERRRQLDRLGKVDTLLIKHHLIQVCIPHMYEF